MVCNTVVDAETDKMTPKETRKDVITSYYSTRLRHNNIVLTTPQDCTTTVCVCVCVCVELIFIQVKAK